MKAVEADQLRWDDIVFENRNKAYGAYVIRSVYSRNVLIACSVAAVIIAFILAYPSIAEYLKGDEEVPEVALKQIKYNELAPPPPTDKNTPPSPKIDIPPPVKTIIKFLPPKVTDKDVVEEEKIPTVEEIKQNDTGAENVEGPVIIFDDPVEEVVKVENNEEAIFTVVEQQAEFPGGFEAMGKFLAKNMKYPAQARRMGVEGSVFVSFVIDKNGNISEPQVIKGISAECDKEAVRVVGLMPPWKPGKQNGKPVKCRFVLPIKFRLAI